ncbi:MAG: hypothetical protein R3D00_01720 [Bacteroidia bacterium]
MDALSKKEIELFIQQFEAKTLPKPQWTHEAHLVVAVWYSYSYGFSEALRLIRGHIIKFNESVGTPNTDTSGYHETMTRFWLISTKEFLIRQEFTSLVEACNAFLHSDLAKKNLPLEFYSREKLFSIHARHNWVGPDKKPLEKLTEFLKKNVKEVQTHASLSDALFENLFEIGTFPVSLFSHEAHLRLAWIHIKKYGKEKAVENVCSQLLQFVEAVGVSDKYNQTLTIAAVNVVNHFINQSATDNFFDFIAEFPQLKNNFKTLITNSHDLHNPIHLSERR